jgi:hypothetical protein
MTPEDTKQICRWGESLDCDVRIILRYDDDERSREIEMFCQALVQLVPRLQLSRETADPGELPALVIGDRAVSYHAVPAGTKLGPFLAALRALGGGKVQETGFLDRVRVASNHLDALAVPALLRLFVMPNCPFCPRVTEQVIALAAANSLVRVAVIDGAFFPEVAETDGVRSAPTLLLDDHFRWTGQLNIDEILEAMTKRDPAELSPGVLEGMLKSGNGSRLIEMMLEREMIFPALIDLLAHEKIFVRVGAMMVMEEIAARRRDITAQVVDAVWDRFHAAEDRVKGDIIHVLGEIGDARVLPRMRRIYREDYHQEVKEAAGEAIEKIETSAEL